MWYRAFGWRENPFSIRPNPNVVGLEEARAALLDTLLSGSPAMVLGETGTGKTSLLLWLAQKLKATGPRPVYLNLHQLVQPAFLLQRIRGSLLHRLLLRKAGVILLFDEAQELKEASANLLKAWYDEGRIHAFVLAACEEPPLPPPLRSRIGINILCLGTLSLAECLALIKARAGEKNPFTEEAMREIAVHAGFSPRTILQLCERICRHFQFKAELFEPITKDDVLYFLSQANPAYPRILPREPARQPETGARHAWDRRDTGTETTETKRAETAETGLSQASFLAELSPMQREILELLLSGPKTSLELGLALKTSPDSVRRQLSRLSHPQRGLPPLVEAVDGDLPKKYKLSDWAKEHLLPSHRRENSEDDSKPLSRIKIDFGQEC